VSGLRQRAVKGKKCVVIEAGLVSDANGTRSDEEHNATLCNMLRLFADVAATDDVISRLR
jgi:hypothetical protein